MSAGSTLLIIGNGFDVQCRLKSRYEDFFEWLRTEKKTADNLWAVHLCTNAPKGQLWSDVEESLEKVLRENDDSRKSIILKWERDANYFYRQPQSGMGLGRTNEQKAAYYICQYMMKLPYNQTPNLFPLGMHWYLEELNKFEIIFAEYLKSEVENNDSYLPNVTKLMDTLLEDNEKVDIITFNYTNPFEGIGFDKSIGKVTHAHGTYAEDNIIFGVDAIAELQDNAHIFTKTYRKMLQKNPSRALPKNVQTIKFYGHSLGPADYSYFHSIFDNYNLYGSDVELKFYFSIYDESKKAEIERGASDRVYKLINVYGTTLDNKDKGKNLLHKLLLEGRLKIEFLDDIKKL